MTEASSWGETAPMPPVDWSLIEVQCTRVGWCFGWVVGFILVAIGTATGADVFLTALRAMLALIGLVLLGRATGVFLSRFAPTESVDEETEGLVGSYLDLRVGDDDEEGMGATSMAENPSPMENPRS
jgi:hypothetical protein